MRSNQLKAARILVVDDQEPNVRVLERMLAREGYKNVRSTQDPTEVVPLFREFEPDLMLLDLHMPNWEGLQILEELQGMVPAERFPPVLMLTGDLTQPARNAALRFGAKEFVTKPFDVTEVLLRIHNLLERRSLQLEVDRLRKASG
jgi:putative two-component system response regulator